VPISYMNNTTTPGTSAPVVTPPSTVGDPYTDVFVYYADTNSNDYTVKSTIGALLKDDLKNSVNVVLHKIELNYQFTGANQQISYNYCYVEEAVSTNMMGVFHGGNSVSSGANNDHATIANRITATMLVDAQIRPTSSITMEPTFYMHASRGVRLALYVYIRRSAPRIVYRELASLK